MTPERVGPFVLYQRLESHAGEAYRARRVVAAGHLSGPLLIAVSRDAAPEVAEALVETAVWGARVAHPGVARVLEVFLHGGSLYSVSELIEGRDLGDVLQTSSESQVPVSVPAALAIGLQLARLGREIHAARGGKDLLGVFRPPDVVLGYDGRVRVRACGAFERPERRDARDPFIAPELARGAKARTSADEWTVARVLRAVLATDPEGRKTPKVSTLYKDSLGPILTEALARDPEVRLSLRALETRLLDMLFESDDSPTRLVVELLEEQANGTLPADDEALSVDDLEALATVDDSVSVELLYPRQGDERGRARPYVDTQVGPAPSGVVDEDSSLFGRVLEEMEREIAQVSDEGVPATSAGGPGSLLRSDLELDVDLSLDEPLAPDAPDEGPDSIDIDLDAIARSSLDGEAFASDSVRSQAQASDVDLSLAGTAVVDRPLALPPSLHEDGDVFQAPAPATRVSRVSSRERSSLARELRSSSSPKTVPVLPAHGGGPGGSAPENQNPNDLSQHDSGVFTATVRPADLLPELARGSSTRVSRSRPNRPSGERSASVPSAKAAPALDPDKTAYLENPAAAFESVTDKRAAAAASAVPSVDDHDEDQPTERLSQELVQQALKLTPRGLASRPGAAPDGSRMTSPSGWGQPLLASVGPSSPDTTALLPVHDVRQILSARGGLDAELPEGEHPPTLDEILPEDPEMGLLVIEVPEGAVVFVNGDQRGKGRTVLEDLDRFASFVVRVHHRGHMPWTGTVTLQGMRAARIEPELRRR